ncbi:hypothetical protein JCM11251_006122 [Rhodosporidiobolus azoricus]
MPAPRAARLAQRKSVVPDPDLYGDPTDSDDSDAQQRASKPPPAPAAKSSSASARSKKGPPPIRGSVTADNGRRRSTRLSNESADGVAAVTSKQTKGSSRSTHAAEAAAPARGKQAASKGKKRAAQGQESASEEDQEDQDEVVRLTAAKKASGARGGSKRTKVDLKEVPDGEEAVSAAPVASSSQAAPPAPRRGFVPRAAAGLAARPNKPPPEYSTVLVDSSADDPEPFVFSTHPPTPHASGQVKRAAAKPKQNPRAKVPRTARPPTESDEITPDDRLPPIPSTSRSRLTPPRQPGSSSAPLHPHETPVQVKNIAFRQGAGPGTPATGGRSVRRSSARGSKNRGSSIGGGFEAVPHPQVADDKLYRSTDADDPLAKRLRSIVSWSAQRTRDRIDRSLPPEKERNEVERLAKEVMDGFIADVCSLRVDTSVPFEEPSQSQDPDQLPPHPQNISNAAKMKELEENYAAIAYEQELRQSLEPAYQSFLDRRSDADASASETYSSLLPPTLSTASSSTPTPEALAKYASSLDLSRPAPTTLEEALELGRGLLAGEGIKEVKSTAGGRKGKGRVSLAPSAMEEEAEGVDRRILEAQIETAQFRHLTHRLSSFARLAQSYITHRSSETHRALASQASLGLGPAPQEGEADQSGLATVLAGWGAVAPAREGEGTLDVRDVLRAISRADAASR